MTPSASAILLGLLALLSTPNPLLAQQPLLKSTCGQATDCTSCMAQGPECTWCYSSKYQDIKIGPGYRCAPLTVLKERGCPANETASEPSQVIPVKPSDGSEQSFHISPKSVTANLRPGDAQEIGFTFKSIPNYPVDMYLLTDMSYTMKANIRTVSESAQKISREMLKVTSAFRFGFGTFVDKPVAPFMSINKDYILSPCKTQTLEFCTPTYLYKHVLEITNDMNLFAKETISSPPSGNVDTPEGGLDALLQVAHCPDLIGWAKEARKIVLLASDGPSHFAGDGKMAGLIEPPPRTCQVTRQADRFNNSIVYTGWHNSTYTDYPSVGEISRVLSETGINVIFATTKEYKPVYDRLAKYLPSAAVGVIGDKSDIVKLLKDNYDAIAARVRLQVRVLSPGTGSDAGGAGSGLEEDTTNPGVTVSTWTRCHNEAEFTEKDECLSNPFSVEYKLKVTVNKCFEGEKIIELGVAGLRGNARIILKSQCKCDKCTKVQKLTNAKNCQGLGDFWCGKCTCSQGFSGDYCECNAKTSVSPSEELKKCTKKGDNEVCSGRGRCSCGTCICSQPDYSGTHCECDRLACPRASDDGSVCGGSDRGKCLCNETCECKPQYTGEACDCIKEGDKSCRSPGAKSNSTVCSGNGDCDCGYCFCRNGWIGALCNERQGGEGALCSDDQLKRCILCLHKKHNGDGEMDCAAKCNATNLETQVPEMVDQASTDDGSNMCMSYDEKECRIYWTYRYSKVIRTTRTIRVKIQSASDCPQHIAIWIIIVAVICGIVGIGIILLLIWKLVITIDDRRELANFQKETENAKWEMEENPIFKAPVTTVTNPTYTGGID